MVHPFVSRDFLKIFLICPIRGATEKEKKFLENYVSKLESKGYNVYYPTRDTQQEDITGGYRICSSNSQIIQNSDEVHVYWNKDSQGSLFDLGTAFSEHKIRGLKVRSINRSDVEEIVSEQNSSNSFEQVILKLDDLANFGTVA